MKNIGTHTVDGVAPGEDFGQLDDATARRRAKQGHIAWDDLRPSHVCKACGFEARSARGLAVHERTHDEEDS